MPLSSLATGDILRVYAKESGDWTEDEVVRYQRQVEGLVQNLTASEAADYGLDGQRRSVQMLFAANPQINERMMVLHNSRSDGSAVTPRWFEVAGCFEEGRPGQTLLWVVLAYELTNMGTPTIQDET